MEFIKIEMVGQVAKVLLNRPDKFNSFNRQMSLELQHALDNCKNDDNVRCILLTSSGKAFCAGQDLSEAIDPSGPGIEKIVFEHYNPMIERIRNIEKPVVCAVNGVAAGAGASLAISCDIVLASASASFTQAFSKIGLIPDSGGTHILPRIVGYHRAAALMFLSEKISAEEGKELGFVWKVFPDESFADDAMKLAQQLAAMPTRGIGLTKRLLNEGISNDLSTQLVREGKVQVEAANTSDHKEGVKAFLEKRAAIFTGK
ncbi:MAG: enoyl-CoA hydratase-related protein [Flavobacteriales bacterium]